MTAAKRVYFYICYLAVLSPPRPLPDVKKKKPAALQTTRRTRASAKSLANSTLGSPGRVQPITSIINHQNPVPEEIRNGGRDVFNNYIERRKREIHEHNIKVRANVEFETERLQYLN